MTLSIDDLTKTYQNAFTKNKIKQQQMGDGADYMDAHRAGIRAVVTALRDEIAPMAFVTTSVEYECGEIRELFNEILAPRGDEAAGVSALEADGAGLSPASGQAPAAAPDVCTWTRADKSKLFNIQWWHVDCTPGLKRETNRAPCASCGRLVKFVEAAR